MLTVDQVAKLLAVSRNTVIKQIKTGKIKAIRIGELYRIPEEQFEKFITASEVTPDNLVGGTTKL